MTKEERDAEILARKRIDEIRFQTCLNGSGARLVGRHLLQIGPDQIGHLLFDRCLLISRLERHILLGDGLLPGRVDPGEDVIHWKRHTQHAMSVDSFQR